MCTARSRTARATLRPSSPSSRPRSARRFRKGNHSCSPCRGERCTTSTARPARGAHESPSPVRRPRGPVGDRDARARPWLRAAARGRALRVGDRPELQHRDSRESQLRVGRVRELRRDPHRSDLPPRSRQHRHRDDRLAAAGRRPGDRGGAGVPRRVPRQAHGAVRPALAVGRARLARRDRLDVDLRFHVQRDQLDPQGHRPAARLALLAGGAATGAGGDHHRAGLAHLSLRDRHRARGARVTPAGCDGGSDRGRRRVLAAVVLRRAAAPAPRRRGRRSVWRRLHGDRLGRRLYSDGRRARQHHARPPHARLPARHPGRRSRPGRRHRRVSAPVPDRGRDRDAATCSPHRGGEYVKRVALYAAALGFMAFAGFPFYWMLITAFKQNRDLYVGAFDTRHVPWIFNDPPTLEHVRLLFGQTDFLRWIANTLIVVVAVIVRVVPRLIVPGILTVVVFTFTLVLQEFVYALTFISSVDKMTVSLGVPIALVRGDVYHWGALMAAALFTSIPLAIVYNLFIDRFIQGFTLGAVKR